MTSGPDVKTIVTKMFDDEINFQPDLQRREVWGLEKTELVDSILGAWYIPKIHVIEIKETGRSEVLDGQQRLAAIRDFIRNKIQIGGHYLINF
ncbi:DUF262 domain-containing protein [Priestia megaterium]|uniref:DUF262 domain-containing protein n=1 Tax=Priestia megaterium TaxID=1404 RepID=UPI001FD7372F|nr:DUF262 domain-containing protein [Priestia megaterium]